MIAIFQDSNEGGDLERDIAVEFFARSRPLEHACAAILWRLWLRMVRHLSSRSIA